MKLQFTIPGPPRGKDRTRSLGVQHFTTKRTRTYERHIAWCGRVALQCAKVENMWKPNGAMYLDLEIYYENGVRPDNDNVVKAVMDGLSGVLWINDKYIAPRVQWFEEGSREPRVDVTISSMERPTQHQKARSKAFCNQKKTIRG